MEQNREQWGSRVGFVLATIGSAVGLGNFWKWVLDFSLELQRRVHFVN